ncbi:MAG TPA: amino acid ABC transporter permease [Holophaga sp.]|nr:amino acid ABC transporter permease [Holophaga sp.]
MVEASDRIIPLRHYGRWISGAIVLFLLALIVRAFAQGEIDWPVVKEFFLAPVLIKGLGNTLLITLLSILMGLALGVVFAVMRLSKNPVTNTVANVYIWLFRGTPVYLQLLIWFNLALVFPSVNLGFYHGRMVDVMTPFLAALLGLGINEGAYMTEIVRGGILSVDRGQLEAASTLGMTRLMAMRRIVLPQAMRVVIPSIGNEFIGLLKTSSMASTIAFTEILHRAQLIYFVNAKVIELLIVAAAWYMIIVTLFTVIQVRVERRYARGQSHEPPPTYFQQLWRNMTARRRAAAGREVSR